MKVAVLMSTYNGEKYLVEQIDSILKQSYSELHLYIRDDGSTDNTINIIKKMSENSDKITLIEGKNLGYCASFMNLLVNCPEADFYAFSDQDDYWHEDKIKNAVLKMEQCVDKPALYYSEVNAVDENLKPLYSSLYTGIDTVGSSYSTTPVIGCTSMINNALRKVILNHKLPENCVSHDLFLYRLCLAIDGVIVHDTNSYISYRQHGNNVVGISNSPIQKMKAYKKFDKTRSYMAKNFIDIYSNEISERNIKTINKIVHFYDHRVLNKIKIIFDKDFKAKKFKSDLKFLYDVFFEKI